MLILKKNLVKIVLAASISSTLYSSRVNLFAQLPETVSEQKRAFVTLDDLIQDATLLEEYSPLTISGPYKTFKMDKTYDIIVRQDLTLHSQRFVDANIQILFGRGENWQDSRNFLGSVSEVLPYLEKEGIQNQELIDYITGFQVIKLRQFDGQLKIVKFHDFKPIQSTQINSKNDLYQLIEQGIIAQNPDYYFLSERFNSPIIEELRNAGLLNKEISIREKVLGICTLLSNSMEYDVKSHIPFTNRPLNDAMTCKKAVCREIVQYTIQIYNSIINPEKNKVYDSYALPVVFIYTQQDEQYSHTIMLLIDSKNNVMTFFDPSKAMLVQQEIKELQQQIKHTTLTEKYILEQKIISLQTHSSYDCSEYPFKLRRNYR